ncbi:MAG: hypothetical protein DRO99_05375 [Candidatus Aenigmatarchaeota archaeon]|nr:MAG: hypothetical protein DRO99_05375 [Candidatus Aenigmarchaeota archaeon]
MFGFLKKTRKRKRQHDGNAARKQRSPRPASNDIMYDIIKKISDLQDQIGRHDSRICNKIEEHDVFLRESHHEPMKKAVIEIMNSLYNQPNPVREEVVKLIKSDERILSIIGDDKLSAGDVAEKMGLSREHVSRRISELTKCGLLTRIQEGKRVFYVKPENE